MVTKLRLWPVLFVALAGSTGVLAAQSPVDDIEAHFDTLDAQLSKFAWRKDVIKGSLKAVDAIFERYVADHQSIVTLLRVNSKGKVINETTTNGSVGKKFRDVSRQGWFSVANGMKPYYGYVKTGDSYELFWAKPLKIKTRSGAWRAGGAMLARIDLSRSLQSIASQMTKPFAISSNGSRIFDIGLSNGNVKELPVTIKGLDNTTFVFAPEPEPTANTTSDSAMPASAAESAQTNVAPAATDKGKPASVAVEEPTRDNTGRTGTIGRYVPVAVILVLLVLLFVLVGWVKRQEQRRQEGLMARIEGRVSVPVPQTRTIKTQPTAPAKPVSPQRPSSSPIRSSATSVYIPSQTQPPAMPSGQPVPGQTPTSRYPIPQQQVVPPATGTYPVAIPPEVYQKIRQDILADVAPQIRAQVEQEFMAGTKAASNKTRVLVRTLQTHIEDLGARISEANTTYQQLGNALQNTAVRIRDALEGFERQP